MAAVDKALAEAPDPALLYEVIIGYAVDGRAYQAGTKLLGDNAEVRARFASGHWMLADLPDDEKTHRRAQRLWAHSLDDAPASPPADPIARPPSGRFQALRSWTVADPDLKHRARINAGDIVDAEDELYRRFPHLFVQYLEDR
jgi:hypothetical protein